ncbi:speriolin-like [Protopterus annectens]|uniref:speriolin-like n=1 Tax=Protopterus annectens TaxID=7888 RepID=UPI001CFC161A|nr:speriolin-like [Protopterus annectens]
MGAVSGIQSPEWYLDEADAIPPKGIPSAYLEPQRKSGSSSDEIYGACQSPDWDISHLASSPLRRSSGSGGKSRLVAVGGIQSPRKSPQISQKEINERIVGEIAYQLDQRILSYIFPEEVSLTDLTVKNATTDMLEIAKDPMTGEIDSKMLSQMGQNYVDILDRLRINQGYDDKIHPVFTECIFKSYGVLLRRPQPGTQEYLAYNDYNYLHDVIVSTVPEDIAPGCICLLNCLYHFSKTDEKPMFCW